MLNSTKSRFILFFTILYFSVILLFTIVHSSTLEIVVEYGTTTTTTTTTTSTTPTSSTTTTTVRSGGGGRTDAGENGEETVPPTILPIEVKSTLQSITLEPGENETHSLEITNKLDQKINVKIRVEGVVWSLIRLEEDFVDIDANSSEVVNVEVYTLPSTMPGMYTGNIIVESDNITHMTPVTVQVVIPEEELLDVLVEALSNVIKLGEALNIRVTVKNLGETARVKDITMKYSVRELGGEGIITKGEETIDVEDVLSYTKSIAIPDDTLQGRYVIEVNASYWDNRKFATASDTFDVSLLPTPFEFLRPLSSYWSTFVIVFVGTIAVYLALRISRKYGLKSKETLDTYY